MTNISKTIVFFGTDHFSAASLRELIARGFSIAAVVTKPDSQKGRGRKVQKSVVKEIAEAHDIPVWQPLHMSDIAENLAALTAERGEKPIGVLVSYGKIIPQSIIDAFEPGIVNVHPSLLPKYRGPSPIETAILHGDQETGVTIMQLSAAMDAGPIYSQTTRSLDGSETAPRLEETLALQGARQLCDNLSGIIDGSVRPVAQDDQLASYCHLLSKEHSLLNPQQLTAQQAEQQVRAYLTFPKTKARIGEYELVVTKAHVVETAETMLDLYFFEDTILRIDELVGPSGKTMDAAAFLNGYAK